LLKMVEFVNIITLLKMVEFVVVVENPSLLVKLLPQKLKVFGLKFDFIEIIFKISGFVFKHLKSLLSNLVLVNEIKYQTTKSL